MQLFIMRSLKVFLILFFGLQIQALATITIVSVGGVSYSESDANGNFTIYGGIAGTCATRDGVSTCNSCVDGSGATLVPAKACNQKSIYSTLPIKISFKSDKALNNVGVQVTANNSTGQASTPFTNGTTVTAAAGEVTTVSFNWQSLCDIDALPNCMPNPISAEATFIGGVKKIFLGVDENADQKYSDDEVEVINSYLHFVNATDASTTNNVNSQDFCTVTSSAAFGQCGYKLGIGDGKLYLEQVFGSGAATPAKTLNTAPDWYGVALFAKDVSSIGIISTSLVPEPVVLKYNSSYTFDQNIVDGLTNYSNYCLLMGNIDKAQNIYKFNNSGAAAAVAQNVCGSPSEVVGMLTDKSCFISTAAFGSDMAEQVQILREFRNQFLLTHQWGIYFVKKYYEYSPPLAHFIKDSETLRFIVRLFLYPVIGMSWLLLSMNSVFIYILISFFSLFIFYRIIKKRESHAQS